MYMCVSVCVCGGGGGGRGWPPGAPGFKPGTSGLRDRDLATAPTPLSWPGVVFSRFAPPPANSSEVSQSALHIPTKLSDTMP